jgi:hypothetical protein
LNLLSCIYIFFTYDIKFMIILIFGLILLHLFIFRFIIICFLRFENIFTHWLQFLQNIISFFFCNIKLLLNFVNFIIYIIVKFFVEFKFDIFFKILIIKLVMILHNRAYLLGLYHRYLHIYEWLLLRSNIVGIMCKILNVHHIWCHSLILRLQILKIAL